MCLSRLTNNYIALSTIINYHLFELVQILHDSWWYFFPQKLAGSFKMTALSSLWGSAAASEICVYIQECNHDKENIADQDNIEKISSEESVDL